MWLHTSRSLYPATSAGLQPRIGWVAYYSPRLLYSATLGTEAHLPSQPCKGCDLTCVVATRLPLHAVIIDLFFPDSLIIKPVGKFRALFVELIQLQKNGLQLINRARTILVACFGLTEFEQIQCSIGDIVIARGSSVSLSLFRISEKGVEGGKNRGSNR